MKLIIEHCTRYRYAQPVALQPHRLVVTPRDSGELTTLETTLHCEPAASIAWTLDVFGNVISVERASWTAIHGICLRTKYLIGGAAWLKCPSSEHLAQLAA